MQGTGPGLLPSSMIRPGWTADGLPAPGIMDPLPGTLDPSPSARKGFTRLRSLYHTRYIYSPYNPPD
jgi:hypothetical protein